MRALRFTPHASRSDARRQASSILQASGVVFLLLVLLTGLALAKTCPSCGVENRDDAQFCKSCGARLPAPVERSAPSPPRVRAEVNVTGSTVSITSEPSGATVYIDGTSRGTTPLELTGLSPGRHEITVSRSGYRDYSSTFTISGSIGTIIVTTEPVGAEIWVDGEFRGNTTANGLTVPRLSFGSHRIVARMSGFAEASRDLNLSSAGPVPVHLRLGQGRGYLRIESEPPQATVLANGRRLGLTNSTFELAPNRYVLTLQRRGYQDWIGYADVVIGETAYVSEQLIRAPGRKLPFLVAGGLGIVAAGFGALRGETEYSKYRSATNASDAERFRKSTQQWDTFRNVALATGAAFCTVYFVVRW